MSRAVNTRTASGVDWYLSLFEDLEKDLNGDVPSDLHSIRKSAIQQFAKLGFPTTRHEEWKYTDVSPLTKRTFHPIVRSFVPEIRKEDLERLEVAHISPARLVFVDGRFSERLSNLSGLPEGIVARSLADALRDRLEIVGKHLARYADAETNSLTALNTAFIRDGAFIHVPSSVIVRTPLHILCVSTRDGEFVAHPRHLIVLGDTSQASVIESYVSLGEGTYFTNAVSEIVLGANASMEYSKVQMESDRAFHIATARVEMEQSSTLRSHAMMFGGSLVRNNVVAVLNGEGAECTLNGLYLGTGTRHIDNHTTIDHAKPHCPSHELYKGILAGKSKGVFNGKIRVRKDAQKTDAKQTNKNLILSDEASVDTKPQLEIFANDVKCTHGATIGQLEDEQIFYLRSRGVDLPRARDMLIHAFAGDVLDAVSYEPLRSLLHRVVHRCLSEEGGR